MFYLLFLLIIGILLHIYSKKGYQFKFAKRTSTVIIILVVICRYDIGYDYHTYYKLIEEQNRELIEFLFSPLSAFLADIAIYFNTPHLIFILFGLPTFIFTFLCLDRYTRNYSLSVFIFICLFLFSFLSIIRQALAISICFYAYRYIVDRKLLKYIVLVVLASLFHSSALVALCLYWLPGFKIKTLIVLSVLFLIAKTLLLNFLLSFELYTAYLSEDGMVPKGGIFIQYFYMLLLLFCYLIRNNKKQDANDDLFKIVFVGTVLVLIFGPHLGDRIAQYFYIYYTILIPSILYTQPYKYRIYFTKLFYFLFIMYFCLMLSFPFIKGTHSFYIPYKTIFLK